MADACKRTGACGVYSVRAAWVPWVVGWLGAWMGACIPWVVGWLGAWMGAFIPWVVRWLGGSVRGFRGWLGGWVRGWVRGCVDGCVVTAPQVPLQNSHSDRTVEGRAGAGEGHTSHRCVKSVRKMEVSGAWGGEERGVPSRRG